MITTILKTNYGFGIFNEDTVNTEDFNAFEDPAILYSEDEECSLMLKEMFNNGSLDKELKEIDEKNDYPINQNERPLYKMVFNDDNKAIEIRYYERWYWNSYTVLKQIEL